MSVHVKVWEESTGKVLCLKSLKVYIFFYYLLYIHVCGTYFFLNIYFDVDAKPAVRFCFGMFVSFTCNVLTRMT